MVKRSRSKTVKLDPMVEHPPHYHAGTVYEAIRVIEAWELGFHVGNAVKYICRANLKDSRLQNLQKARWYLDREIRNMEAAQLKASVDDSVRRMRAGKKVNR